MVLCRFKLLTLYNGTVVSLVLVILVLLPAVQLVECMTLKQGVLNSNTGCVISGKKRSLLAWYFQL